MPLSIHSSPPNDVAIDRSLANQVSLMSNVRDTFRVQERRGAAPCPETVAYDGRRRAECPSFVLLLVLLETRRVRVGRGWPPS